MKKMAPLVQFYSKHEEFRVLGKYVDVTIKCEDKYFKCHRNILAAACDFFDVMFSSDFKEKTEEDIVLSEIDAEIFKYILLYMYTGHIVIDSSNVYRLLQASDYFGLSSIEEKCVEFVQRNRMSVDNTFNIFVYACATKKNKLVEILCADIVEQFRIFSRSNKFLELSVNDLNLILDHWVSLPSLQNDELFFSAVVRWVFHSRKNRFQHIDHFLKLFQSENIKSQYLVFVIGKLLMTKKSDNVALSRTFKPAVDYDDIPQLPRGTLKLTRKSLHVYVKDVQENLVRIFSINNHMKCTITGQIPATSANQRFRTLALDDCCLYSLHFGKMGESSDQFFHFQRSADMHSPLSLTPPPVIFEDISWASLQNNIYVYNKMLSERRPGGNVSLTTFSDEEIRHGIYMYNCDLDCWFPVPKMMNVMKHADLVTHDNIVYVIGGMNINEPNSVGTKVVQAYDYRVGRWQELANMPYFHINAACCVFQEKIYVCGGGGPGVSMYDPKTGKWLDMGKYASGMPIRGHQAISYSDQIWLIGGCDGPVLDYKLYVQTSSFRDVKDEIRDWNTSSILTDTAEQTISTTEGIIMDCVIFTSL